MARAYLVYNRRSARTSGQTDDLAVAAATEEFLPRGEAHPLAMHLRRLIADLRHRAAESTAAAAWKALVARIESGVVTPNAAESLLAKINGYFDSHGETDFAKSLGTHPEDLRRRLRAFAGSVAWWKLDEESGDVAADSSGNGLDGALEGGPALRPTGGRIGGAVHFAGVDQFIEVPDHDLLDITRSLMLACWTKGDRGWWQVGKVLYKKEAYAFRPMTSSNSPLATGSPSITLSQPIRTRDRQCGG